MKPGLKTLLWRGARKRCPQCGEGPLYRRWMILHESCPVCGLQYLANRGDLLGPLVFLDRVLFLIPLILLCYFRILDTSQPVLLALAGVLIFLLIFTMPHRNGVSLALDYLIRRKSGDLPEPSGTDRPWDFDSE
jgi:uncharacterized protein (DUF983 family)